MVHEVLSLEALNALEPSEAAAYFVTRRAEGLTAGEQQMLAGWLAKNEVHRRMFESADRAWQCFDKPDGDEVLAAMRAHALGARSRMSKAWRPAAAAAAVAFLVAGAVFLVPLNRWIPLLRGPAPVVPLKYASARGEVRDIPLPDGSAMTLDADSTAVGRFGTDSRTIEMLRGRAFFTVMPDRARPFTVVAAGRSIVAVGTRFDVNLVRDGLTVTLLDGHLDLGSADHGRQHLTLQPGQQYTQRRGKETIRTIGAATENEVAWRVGLIHFDDQPLDDAVSVMNRYSNDQILINDPTVASIRVSGQFHAGDSERFVATLAEIHKLRSVRRAGQIELVPQE